MEDKIKNCGLISEKLNLIDKKLISLNVDINKEVINNVPISIYIG